jgi:hypothetical protein
MPSFSTAFDTTGDGVDDTFVDHDEIDMDGDGTIDEYRTRITRRTDSDVDGVDDTIQRWEREDWDGDGNAERSHGETTKDNPDGTSTTTSTTSEDANSDGTVDGRTRTTRTSRAGGGSDQHEEIDSNADGEVDVTRDTKVETDDDGFSIHVTEDTDGDGNLDHETWTRYSDTDGDGVVEPGSKWQWERWDANNDGRWERQVRSPGATPDGAPDAVDAPSVGEPWLPEHSLAPVVPPAEVEVVEVIAVVAEPAVEVEVVAETAAIEAIPAVEVVEVVEVVAEPELTVIEEPGALQPVPDALALDLDTVEFGLDAHAALLAPDALELAPPMELDAMELELLG